MTPDLLFLLRKFIRLLRKVIRLLKKTGFRAAADTVKIIPGVSTKIVTKAALGIERCR